MLCASASFSDAPQLVHDKAADSGLNLHALFPEFINQELLGKFPVHDQDGGHFFPRPVALIDPCMEIPPFLVPGKCMGPFELVVDELKLDYPAVVIPEKEIEIFVAVAPVPVAAVRFPGVFYPVEHGIPALTAPTGDLRSA